MGGIGKEGVAVLGVVFAQVGGLCCSRRFCARQARAAQQAQRKQRASRVSEKARQSAAVLELTVGLLQERHRLGSREDFFFCILRLACGACVRSGRQKPALVGRATTLKPTMDPHTYSAAVKSSTHVRFISLCFCQREFV